MKKTILDALRWVLKGINFVCVKLRIAKPTLGPAEAGGYWHPTTRRHIELTRFIRECGVAVDASILDVGCGPGGLIERLVKSGYRNIRGCDWRDERFDRHRRRLHRSRSRAVGDGRLRAVSGESRPLEVVPRTRSAEVLRAYYQILRLSAKR